MPLTGPFTLDMRKNALADKRGIPINDASGAVVAVVVADACGTFDHANRFLDILNGETSSKSEPLSDTVIDDLLKKMADDIQAAARRTVELVPSGEQRAEMFVVAAVQLMAYAGAETSVARGITNSMASSIIAARIIRIMRGSIEAQFDAERIKH